MEGDGVGGGWRGRGVGGEVGEGLEGVGGGGVGGGKGVGGGMRGVRGGWRAYLSLLRSTIFCH